MTTIGAERLARAAEAIRAATGAGDVLVYGSAAAGRLRPDSDVDLAYLAAAPPSAETYLRLLAELVAVLGRPADLVSLTDASPVLRIQVLRTGRPLLGPPSRAFARWTMATVTAYADLKLARAPAERALRRRFGGA